MHPFSQLLSHQFSPFEFAPPLGGTVSHASHSTPQIDHFGITERREVLHEEAWIVPREFKILTSDDRGMGGVTNQKTARSPPLLEEEKAHLAVDRGIGTLPIADEVRRLHPPPKREGSRFRKAPSMASTNTDTKCRSKSGR